MNGVIGDQTTLAGTEPLDVRNLIILCHDAAIRDLVQAKAFHENGEMERTYEKNRHAQDLITELLVGLDYEQGGEIAQNLSRLYNFMIRSLVDVNSNSNPAMCYDPLIRILSELQGAWQQSAAA